MLVENWWDKELILGSSDQFLGGVVGVWDNFLGDGEKGFIFCLGVSIWGLTFVGPGTVGAGGGLYFQDLVNPLHPRDPKMGF
jgi:hypothetical protein